MAVVADVTTVACNTSTGEQTITISGLGVTPKAAIFICTSATVADTNTAHVQYSYGFTDGTNHRVTTNRAKDANNTELADRRGATNEVVMILNTGNNNVNGEANFVSFNADNVIINWGNAPGSAFLLTVILVGGADFSAFVGDFNQSITEDSTFAVTGVGFKPDVINAFGSYTSNPFGDATAGTCRLCVGWANRDTTDDSGDQNRCLAFKIHDGAAVGDPRAQYRNSLFTAADADVGDVGLQLDPASTAFGSDGFTVTSRNGIFAGRIAYLAMSFGGVNDFAVWEFSTPTSSSFPHTDTDTGPGFKPQFVMYITHQFQVANTRLTDLDAGVLGVSAFSANNETCNVLMDEDGPTSTNTACVTGTSAVLVPLDDQTAAFDADFSSMEATGPSLTWNDNETDAARLWIGFAIEEDPTGFVPYPDPRGLEGGAIAMSGGLQ